ncbi:hypothetical protein D9619_000183 [Psilocybe cf. subviscida]|uniref:Uncharacterized protein n=1 Tax=Psilocybe cf. subviscida TaxID=2480587 RepID=A0A8H5BFP4_9AGAR|nr:hypothetical protein D9619_000183 [Psilocybe cf. subviscida]
MVNQFKGLDLNFLDTDREQIDLWPFSITDKSVSIQKISEDFSLALEICRFSTTGNQLLQGTKVTVSHQTALLSRLMPHLPPRWLERRDLFGRYAMTTERYGTALQRIAYYLLRLPKDVLADILNDSGDEKDILQTPLMRLICKVLPTFLTRSPRSTDLYFLVALADPVMAYIVMYGNPYVSTYLEKALKEYPFLKDPTSSDYIEARLKVEEPCIKLKITTSFHELVEDMDLTDEELVPYKELLDSFTIIDRRVPESGLIG